MNCYFKKKDNSNTKNIITYTNNTTAIQNLCCTLYRQYRFQNQNILKMYEFRIT